MCRTSCSRTPFVAAIGGAVVGGALWPTGRQAYRLQGGRGVLHVEHTYTTITEALPGLHKWVDATLAARDRRAARYRARLCAKYSVLPVVLKGRVLGDVLHRA